MSANMPDRNMPVKNEYSYRTVEAAGMRGHTLRMDNLKTLREARGLSQAELAEMIGVNQGYVSKMEAGTANPSLDKIIAIAKALHAEPAELFSLPALQRRAIAALGAMASPDRQEAALVVLEAMAQPPR